MKKLLRGLGVTVLAVVLLYYVGVNALLASPWGEVVMNQKPELGQIHYTRAWTIIPLQFEVRDFQLSLQDPLVQVVITADRVQGNLHPWTLLELRFLATGVDAEGVTMRVRSRITKGEPLEQYLAELPPIAGYETPMRDVSPSELLAGRYLSLEFKDLRVKHLREVWIDRMRYTGDASVTGGMLYEPFRRLRLDTGHFTDAKSQLTTGIHQVAIGHLDVEVTTSELNLGALDFASLRGVMAKLELSASAPPDFLNGYLTNARGLSTFSASGAPGQLELSVEVVHGLVQDGGKLTFDSKRIAVRLPVVEVWGVARVVGAAENGRLALDLDVTQAGLRQRDGEHLMKAERFSLNTSSPADLTRAIDVDAVLTLKSARIDKLTAINTFIPEGTGVHLTAGSGTVSGTLRLDSVPPRARGEFELVASNVTLENRAATIAGKLLVSGKLVSLDLHTGAMDLSGSTISIEDATLQAQKRRWPKLWLRAVAEQCVLTPKAKVLWSAKLAVGSSNLQPLLAIVSANAPIPGALALVTDSPNVKVEATVLVRADGVDLPRMSLVSQNVRAEGAMTLRELSATDPKLEPWGSVVVHAGALSAGVQLDGPKVSVVFGDLERWSAGRKSNPASVVR